MLGKCMLFDFSVYETYLKFQQWGSINNNIYRVFLKSPCEVPGDQVQSKILNLWTWSPEALRGIFLKTPCIQLCQDHIIQNKFSFMMRF
jgi:hypothetical protein